MSNPSEELDYRARNIEVELLFLLRILGSLTFDMIWVHRFGSNQDLSTRLTLYWQPLKEYFERMQQAIKYSILHDGLNISLFLTLTKFCKNLCQFSIKSFIMSSIKDNTLSSCKEQKKENIKLKTNLIDKWHVMNCPNQKAICRLFFF